MRTLPVWLWAVFGALAIGLLLAAVVPRKRDTTGSTESQSTRCRTVRQLFEDASAKNDAKAAETYLVDVKKLCSTSDGEYEALRGRVDTMQKNAHRDGGTTTPQRDAVPDSSSESWSTGTASRQRRIATVRQASYLFDSKDSLKEASRAAARGDNVGFLEVAAAHGVAVHAGEEVLVLERGWVDTIRVRSLESQRAGWTPKDVIVE